MRSHLFVEAFDFTFFFSLFCMAQPRWVERLKSKKKIFIISPIAIAIDYIWLIYCLAYSAYSAYSLWGIPCSLFPAWARLQRALQRS